MALLGNPRATRTRLRNTMRSRTREDRLGCHIRAGKHASAFLRLVVRAARTTASTTLCAYLIAATIFLPTMGAHAQVGGDPPWSDPSLPERPLPPTPPGERIPGPTPQPPSPPTSIGPVWQPGDPLPPAYDAVEPFQPDIQLPEVPKESVRASQPIGSLPGQFQVADDGSATYSIPIPLPSGRAGIEPALSLNYSSRAPDSPYGFGWSLGGLSVVTLCPGIPAIDGRSQTPTWLRGPFCLDGARLLRVPSTVPDADAKAIEYRLESDTGVRVVRSALPSGEFGDRFQVFYPDGRVAELRPLDHGVNAPISWALTRLEDQHGNYLTVRYRSETFDVDGVSFAQTLPDSIAYTMHESQPNESQVRIVGFVWKPCDPEEGPCEPETAPRFSFAQGARIGFSKRLDRLQILSSVGGNGSHLISEMRLNHRDIEDHRLLTSVQWCDRHDVCLPSTRFTYDRHVGTDRVRNRIRFGDVDAAMMESADRLVPSIADLDGDGRREIVVRTLPLPEDSLQGPEGGVNEGVKVIVAWNDILESGTPAWHRQAITLSDLKWRGALPAPSDLDGDGRAEFFVPVATDGRGYPHRWALLNVGRDGEVEKRQEIALRNGATSIQTTDMDGNAWPEIVYTSDRDFTDYRVLVPTADGRFEEQSDPLLDPAELSEAVGAREELAWTRAQFVDLDGNGADDILISALRRTYVGVHPRGHEQVWYATTLGAGWRAAVDSARQYVGFQSEDPSGLLPSDVTTNVFADLNADGLPDQVYLRRIASDAPGPNDEAWCLRYRWNVGTGFFSEEHDTEAGWLVEETPCTGGPAMVVVPTNRGVHSIARPVALDSLEVAGQSSDISVEDSHLEEPLEWFHTTSQFVVGDVGGDGEDELLYFVRNEKRESPYAILHIRGLASRARMTEVTNGYGANTAIRYAPLTGAPTVSAGSSSNHDASGVYVRTDRCLETGGGASPDTRNVSCLRAGFSVVHEVDFDAGLNSREEGNLRTLRYQYVDGRMDRGGRGFLGFRRRRIIDEQRHAVTEISLHPLSSATGLERFAQHFHPRATLPAETVSVVGLDTGHALVTRRTLAVDKFHVGATEEQWAKPHRPAATLTTDESYEVAGFDPLDVSSEIPLLDAIDARDAFARMVRSTSTELNEDGNVVYRKSVNGLVHTTEESYVHDPKPYVRVGMVAEAHVVSTRDGHQVEHLTTATYDDDGLLLSSTRGLPGDASRQVTTTILYNDYGLPTLVQQETANEPVRWSRTTYDENGYFAVATTNALGHTATAAVHPDFGTPVVAVDANGVMTRAFVDGFGRLVESKGPQEAATTFVLERISSDDDEAPSLAAYRVRMRSADGGTATTYYDRLQRPLRTVRPTRFGRARSDVVYDRDGRVAKRTRPHFPDDSVDQHVSYHYDRTGRLTRAQRSDGYVIREHRYEGYRTDSWLGDRHTYEVLNPEGWIEKSVVVEEDGEAETVFVHGAEGLLRSVTDALGFVTTVEYDAEGRRVRVTAPSAGAREYEYNGFGEVVEERRMGSNRDGGRHVGSTTSLYDQLGRKRFWQTDWTTAHEAVVQIWDDAPTHGVGRLARSYHVQQERAVSRSYDYDIFGNVTTNTLSVPSAVSGWLSEFPDEPASFTISSDYDEFGRLETLTYPAPARADGASTLLPPAPAVDYAYDEYGDVARVEDASGTIGDSLALWQARRRDALGRTTSEALLGGINAESLTRTRTFDPTTGALSGMEVTRGEEEQPLQRLELVPYPDGRLRERYDHVNGEVERYAYDLAGRLDTWDLDTGEGEDWVERRAYAFDEIGRLLYVESGAYDAATGRFLEPGAAPVEGKIEGYDYEHPNYPHVATKKTTASEASDVIEYRDLSFDAYGRQTYRDLSASAFRVLSGHMEVREYNAFDLPENAAYAEQSGWNTYWNDVRFLYDADGDRVLQQTRTPNERTVSHSGLYELRSRHVVGSERVERESVYYFPVEGGTFAQLRVDGSTGARSYDVLLKEPNGSVSQRVGDDGASAGLKYTPFGQGRANTHRSEYAATPQSAGVSFGYTGHEHDEALGLINMKGRFYDPEMRQFLSPDPYVPAPGRGDGYNRYAYVLGDPINLTDPSGFAPVDCGPDPSPGSYCGGPAAGAPAGDGEGWRNAFRAIGRAFASLFKHERRPRTRYVDSSATTRTETSSSLDATQTDVRGHRRSEAVLPSWLGDLFRGFAPPSSYDYGRRGVPYAGASGLEALAHMDSRVALQTERAGDHARFWATAAVEVVNFGQGASTAVVDGAVVASQLAPRVASSIGSAARGVGPAGASVVRSGAPRAMVKQLSANACGMACGQQLLREHGVEVLQSQLTNGFYRGIEPARLIENMNRFMPGWTGGYAYPTAAQLTGLASRGSFIARIGGNSGHFVIVDSIQRGVVAIRDPAGGVARSLALSEFSEIVSGVIYR